MACATDLAQLQVESSHGGDDVVHVRRVFVVQLVEALFAHRLGLVPELKVEQLVMKIDRESPRPEIEIASRCLPAY